MKKHSSIIAILAPLALTTLTAAACDDEGPDAPSITEVASFGLDMPTGVAVSSTGRTFVSFPKLFVPPSGPGVVEILPDGSLTAYPDDAMNSWQPGESGADEFVSIQSLYIDRNDHLWLLDPAGPYPADPAYQGVIPGAAKLIEIDLASDTVVRTIRFDDTTAPPQSNLNDIRINPAGTHAYITDAGIGGLVVVDLRDNSARAVLTDHTSMKAEAGFIPNIDGEDLLLPTGEPPPIHADGIALLGDHVYYHALTGETLYRIRADLLEDTSATEAQLAAGVETVATTGAHDGILSDGEGNLYLSDLENNAISRYTADGALETVISDPRLQWPDSLAFSPDGTLYVTLSQVHRLPPFNLGADTRTEDHLLVEITLP